ncbi:TorD/DmsD family molecular chaperone [Symbiobacterium thermophilum]|nr:molecular chaperone TorD family protein [Symbiobacterium thermophilum]
MDTADPLLFWKIRAEVYRLLAGLFSDPPDDRLLGVMRHPGFLTEWPLGRGQPDVERGLARLAAVLPAVRPEELRREFWDLFGTLGPAAAPPWQSVYLDREGALMGEETLRVRALYARFGLEAEQALAVTDDHIAVQLAFLGELSRQTAECLEGGDEAGARELVDGQRECLEDHLLRWADRFVDKVEAASVTGFYAGVARMTLGLFRSDVLLLREWLTELAQT